MSEALQIGSDGVLTLDLSGVDKPAPEGWHTVEVEKASPGTSSNDNMRIFVVARDVCMECDHAGNTIVWNSMLEGPGLTFTKRFLDAAGYGVDQKLQFNSVDELAESMIGRELRVKVVHNDDSPSGYNVNAYAPAEAEAEDITW